MSGVISFDELFEPVKPNPIGTDRVVGWDSEAGVTAAFTMNGIKALFGGGDWNTMANRPSTFAAAAHTLGSHSNMAAGVDDASDGKIMLKAAGKWGASTPPWALASAIPNVPAWVLGITETEKANWNTAYGWGDHATVGYLTSYEETDPTVGAHIKSITATEKANWNTAYGWGNHAAVGYLTSFEETDPVFSASPAAGISIPNIGVWDAKATEFAGLSDNSLLLLAGGAPKESGIIASWTDNPFDPELEPEDYEAWVPELINFTFPTVVKGVDAVELDELATLGQIPVLYDVDLEAIAGATAHGAGNVFATIADIFTVAGTATEGYVATVVGGVPTWAEASGGGGLTEGVNALTERLIFKGNGVWPQSGSHSATRSFLSISDNADKLIFDVNPQNGNAYEANGRISMLGAHVYIDHPSGHWGVPVFTIRTAGVERFKVTGSGGVSLSDLGVATFSTSSKALMTVNFQSWGAREFGVLYNNTGGYNYGGRWMIESKNGALSIRAVNLFAINDTTAHSLRVWNDSGVKTMEILGNHSIYLFNYPTADPLDAGKLWSDPAAGYALKISQG